MLIHSLLCYTFSSATSTSSTSSSLGNLECFPDFLVEKFLFLFPRYDRRIPSIILEEEIFWHFLQVHM